MAHSSLSADMSRPQTDPDSLQTVFFFITIKYCDWLVIGGCDRGGRRV